MNSLTLPPQNEPPTKPTWPALGPGLRSLLELEPSDSRAIQELLDGGFLEEAKAALPAIYELATTPAGEAGVQQVVGSRFAMFAQPHRSDAMWSAWWRDYYAVLASIPEPSLEAGMVAWIKLATSRFLPMPGELRELALDAVTRPARAADRIQTAIRADEVARFQAMLEPIVPRSAEEMAALAEQEAANRAKVREMAAELRDHFKATVRKPKIELPPIHGKPDQTGITPQMRELANRQSDA